MLYPNNINDALFNMSTGSWTNFYSLSNSVISGLQWVTLSLSFYPASSLLTVVHAVINYVHNCVTSM